jgi:tRNA (guanine37-N1)-methyltransferase
MINSYMNQSILKRAAEKKLVAFEVKNIRDYSKDRHNKTDDRPYGGGPGMVMTAEPILNAFGKLKLKKGGKVKAIQLSPSGKMFTNAIAKKMAKQYSDIVFICGRYEGVDDRVRKILKADEYSVGDYTVTGGELPALIMTDAIARQIPGVLGKGESVEETRIASPRVYTRPETLVYKGKKHKVPTVLLNGDHKKIDEWRKKQQK